MRVARRSTTHNVIIALSLGIKTGWAIVGQDGVFRSGTKIFNSKPNELGTQHKNFKRWLEELLVSHGDALVSVYFADVKRHATIDDAHNYGGYLAYLAAECADAGVSCIARPIGAIKRYATGTGKANAKLIRAAARERGFMVTSDHEARAVALLHLAMYSNGVGGEV